MRALLSMVALALGLVHVPQTKQRAPVRAGGAGASPSCLRPICNAVEGTPWPQYLRERRRWNIARKFTTGHWQTAARWPAVAS